MRVLWFSNTAAMFNLRTNSHNGGGWISSLERIVRDIKEIDLGIAINLRDDNFKYESNGVVYYPVSGPRVSKIKRIFGREKGNSPLQKYLDAINDFKPDLIQIFGTENNFGIICRHTAVPVVTHIQGNLYLYGNALYPIGINKYDFLFSKGLSLMQRYVGLKTEKSFEAGAKREIETLKSCGYFMGRTHWDKNIVEMFNPGAKYFHCEEALRDSFLERTRRWEYQKVDKATIVSTISRPWYKGVDLILKTAAFLKTFTDLEFEWRVYGVKDLSFYQAKYKINPEEVGVRAMGTASKDELADVICNASCYVHPSYIDNSPNGVCEAQILGIPVISTNVGGISSLVKHGETGLLFPANDPLTLASYIKRVVSDKELALSLSDKERAEATRRHDPDNIRESLLAIYREILADAK